MSHATRAAVPQVGGCRRACTTKIHTGLRREALPATADSQHPGKPLFPSKHRAFCYSFVVVIVGGRVPPACLSFCPEFLLLLHQHHSVLFWLHRISFPVHSFPPYCPSFSQKRKTTLHFQRSLFHFEPKHTILYYTILFLKGVYDHGILTVF